MIYNADATSRQKNMNKAREKADLAIEQAVDCLTNMYCLSPYEVVVTRIYFEGLIKNLTDLILLPDVSEFLIYKTLINFWKTDRKMGL